MGYTHDEQAGWFNRWSGNGRALVHRVATRRQEVTGRGADDWMGGDADSRHLQVLIVVRDVICRPSIFNEEQEYE